MAFSGKATYDNYLAELMEDVSETVTMVSPTATPFLEEVGDASNMATNPYHTWIEDKLNPQTVSVSSAIDSTAAASGGLEIANASWIRVDDIFRLTWSGEHMLVTSLGASAATIYVTRAYAGTVSTSAAAAATLEFLGNAAFEGSAKKDQRSQNRTLKGNYVQTFREDIQVSMRRNNATQKGSLPSQYEVDKVNRTKEVMRQLEKSVLMGRTAGNTIGTSTTRTVMAGVYHSIATNIVSNATYSNSLLGNVLAKMDAYCDVNGNDYFLACGTTIKRRIDDLNASKTIVISNDQAYTALVSEITTTFGTMRALHCNRLPVGSALIVKRDSVKVTPYAGESFGARSYEDGTHAVQGYVIGTYTVEFRNEEASGRIDGVTA